MPKILVTGNKGFIGSVVFTDLKEKGYDVTGVDVEDAFPQERFDIIFHFGARTLIRNSVKMPYEYFLDNLGLLMQYLEKARKDNSIIIFPTSGSTAKPTNPYSLAKKESEEWLELYNNLYGVKYYTLRFYNIYGETSRKGAVYLFTKAAFESSPAILFGDGTHKRDFVYVHDISRISEKIINGEINPGTYEVGTGIGTSINDLIKLIERKTNKKIIIEHKSFEVDEAESLSAKNPMLSDFTPIEKGLDIVISHFKKV